MVAVRRRLEAKGTGGQDETRAVGAVTMVQEGGWGFLVRAKRVR